VLRVIRRAARRRVRRQHDQAYTKPNRNETGALSSARRDPRIHVALLDPKSRADQGRFKFLEDGRKVRFARASGETIDARRRVNARAFARTLPNDDSSGADEGVRIRESFEVPKLDKVVINMGSARPQRPQAVRCAVAT